jgi:hypothetical protein
MASSLDYRIIRVNSNPDIRWKGLSLDRGEPVLGDNPEVESVIASFIHLSDLHICDAASPARMEYLDRIADPDNPLSAMVPAYRATLLNFFYYQEF